MGFGWLSNQRLAGLMESGGKFDEFFGKVGIPSDEIR